MCLLIVILTEGFNKNIVLNYTYLRFNKLLNRQRGKYNKLPVILNRFINGQFFIIWNEQTN